jgi:acyl dehydratase
MSTTTTMAELAGLGGRELGTSGWHEVTQGHVDLFAQATGDHQWIHVDVERARAESPFGGPVAHGYLTLALIVPLFWQVLTVTDVTTVLNYGLNKARFPAPVPVGSQVRMIATLAAVEPVRGGLQITTPVVIERQGGDRPVCVAEMVWRYLGG